MKAYPIAFLLGSVIGLLWLGWGLPRAQLHGTHAAHSHGGSEFLDAGLWALALGLLGARLAFAAGHWSYYFDHPTQILWFGQGGLSWVGGALGGLLGVGVFKAISHKPFSWIADAIAVPAVILFIALWIGCLLDGCAYGVTGAATGLGWMSPDLFGSVARRWPTQTIAAVGGLGLLLALERLRHRHLKPGLLACIASVGVALILLGLSVVRADPVPLFGGVRQDTIGASLLLIVSLAAAGALLARRESMEVG
jgi:prolipoprotein diacylglyceryltransferase